MATVTRLRTKPERLRHDQAEVLRQALLPFAETAMAPHVRALIAQIDRETSSALGWTFVMLSASQNAAVVNHLAGTSSRPVVALRVWALAFEHLDRQTGEIMLSRDEIAERIGVQADNISRVMGELERCGAIIKRRVRVPGMRGRGGVRYYMNPSVATHLTGSERDRAQAQAPQLRLV